jgi:hypothetical protein
LTEWRLLLVNQNSLNVENNTVLIQGFGSDQRKYSLNAQTLNSNFIIDDERLQDNTRTLLPTYSLIKKPHIKALLQQKLL